MDEFREYVSCRLCGANDFEIVYKWPANYYDHSLYETASWDGRKKINLRICRCNKCGLAYSNPSFKKEYLNIVYPNDLIPPYSKINSHEEFERLLRLRKHRKFYSLIKNDIRNSEVILDVGTRYGGLPYYLRKNGYCAFGLEYNNKSVELANNFGVDYIYQGTSESINNYIGTILPQYIDCVIMDDVLEHLIDPLNDIYEIYKIQPNDTIIIMRQMNWDGLGHKIFKNNWYYLQPAAHMSYFSPNTAIELLKKCGYNRFKILEENKIKNILNTTKHFVKRFVQGNKNNDRIISGKYSYLGQRYCMVDDMFTIIGYKN